MTSVIRAIRFAILGLLAALLVGCGLSDRSPNETSPSEGDHGAEFTELELTKQKYIWKVEHIAFELEKKFGKQFCEALKTGDAAALDRFFQPGCSGELLASDEKQIVNHDFLTESTLGHHQGGQQHHTTHVESDALAAHLCGYFKDFADVRKVSFRVLDLHAKDRDPTTGVWQFQLYLQAAGVDADRAPLEFLTHHTLDCRFNSDDDIVDARIVTHWRVLDEQFRSATQPLFEETTAAAGLDNVDIRDNWNSPKERVRQYHTQMAVEDFDRDGFFDLAVASSDGRWRLLKSLAGQSFQEVGDQLGIPAWSDEEPRSRAVFDQAFLATWLDFDNDGFPDLLLGDRLFHNVQGERFEDVTDRSGLFFAYNPRGCVVADYDCDGLVDLYVLYQHERSQDSANSGAWVGDDDTGAENQLWRNEGNGRFRNMTGQAKASGGKRQTFAAAWLFVNEDHFPDLYVANDFGINSLLINQGDGKFRDHSAEAGVADFATSMGVVAGDVTGDGEPEIYVANMFSKMGRRIIAHVGPDDYPPGVFAQIQGSCAGNRLYTPGTSGTGPYREISEAFGVNPVGWAYAPAMADFDADGFLDIYATTGFLSYERGKPDG